MKEMDTECKNNGKRPLLAMCTHCGSTPIIRVYADGFTAVTCPGYMKGICPLPNFYAGSNQVEVFERWNTIYGQKTK
jgi:hypothetical protein